MSEKKALKVKCTSTPVSENSDQSFKQNIENFFGIPKAEDLNSPNAENISQRYTSYMENLLIEDKTAQRINLLSKNAEELEQAYSKAIKYIKPEIAKTLRMENYNIVVQEPFQEIVTNDTSKVITEFFYNESSSPNKTPIWRHLFKSDFIRGIDENQKIIYYRAIRDYLFIQYTKERAQINKTKRLKYFKTPTENTIIKEQHTQLIKTTHSILGNVPFSVLDFLYKLSCGNLKLVKSLAKLQAQIQYPHKNILPTVILADKSIHEPLREFFMNPNKVLEVDLHSIITQKGGILLFMANLNNYFSACLSINTPIPLSQRKSERLHKVMHGSKLNITYPDFSGDLFVHNRIPFIYITDSHENFNIMKYQYGAKTIVLPSKTAKYINNTDGRNWLTNDFAAFGKLISSVNNTVSVLQPKINEDSIIEKFIEDVCILDKNADIPKAQLFEAYQNYFQKHYGNTTLTRKQFSCKIAIIADLDECRPHHNSKRNPRCFKGITVDNEKYVTLIQLTDSDKFLCDFESFSDSLYEMMYKNLLTEEDFEYYKKRSKNIRELKVKLSE